MRDNNFSEPAEVVRLQGCKQLLSLYPYGKLPVGFGARQDSANG